MPNPETTSSNAQFVELGGRNVANNRQMLRRRLQVLPQREKIAANVAQVAERVEQLFVSLTETEHQAALGLDRRIELFDATQQFQRLTT